MNKVLTFTMGFFCLFGNVNASLEDVIIPNIGWHNAKVKQTAQSKLDKLLNIDTSSHKNETHERAELNNVKHQNVAWQNSKPVQAKDELTNLEKTIYKIEQKYGIPQGLLYALALTESGKMDQNTKKFTAWPWTVNANGRSYYLKSKQEAMQKVKELQDSGVYLIDVGCMQINLAHHSKAFKSLNEAFTPEKNIEYAAKFLTGLYEQKKSWEKATKCYHSANELLGNKYYCSVMKNYQKVLKMPKPPQHEEKGMHYLCKNDVKVSHYLCKNNQESFDDCVKNEATVDDAISKRLKALGKMVLARNSRY